MRYNEKIKSLGFVIIHLTIKDNDSIGGTHKCENVASTKDTWVLSFRILFYYAFFVFLSVYGFL